MGTWLLHGAPCVCTVKTVCTVTYALGRATASQCSDYDRVPLAIVNSNLQLQGLDKFCCCLYIQLLAVLDRKRTDLLTWKPLVVLMVISDMERRWERCNFFISAEHVVAHVRRNPAD